MESSSDDIASVSNPPHHIQLPAREDCDTESILSLINQLSFEIKEESKQKFFNELERILEKEHQKDYGSYYSDVIDFFIKHISSEGKISA